MAAPRVMHGARAQVIIGNKIIGMFNSISYSVGYDAPDVFILGRFSAAAIEYTAAEPVSGSLSGWRVVGAGAHAGAGLPRVQDLMNADYITLAVLDRQTNKRIAVIKSARLLGASSGQSARQLSELSIPFKGILMDDESGENNEGAGAGDLGTGIDPEF